MLKLRMAKIIGAPDNGPLGLAKEPIGYSGAIIELDDINSALDRINSRSHWTRGTIIRSLQEFFGPPHDGSGKAVFLKWGAEAPASRGRTSFRGSTWPGVGRAATAPPDSQNQPSTVAARSPYDSAPGSAQKHRVAGTPRPQGGPFCPVTKSLANIARFLQVHWRPRLSRRVPAVIASKGLSVTTI